MSGKRFAILIASSKFPEEPGLTELRCPENDVDALNEILSLPELGGFEEPLVFKNAPSHEIMPQINRILLDADKDDLVLIYFSGHGKRNRPLHLHLATANTRINTLETTSIPAQMLGYLFEHSYSKRKILLLDCCRSGAVGKLFTKGGDDEELLRISEADGTFIMTACAAEQLAQEGQQHSVFTKHLIEGIRSGEADRNEDGWVDMDELFGYVRDRVRAEKNAQLPQSWHSHNGGELIISRSGMKSREKRTQEIKTILLEFVQEDKLTPGVALEAVQLLSISKRGMTEQEQACSLLIEQLVGAKISPPVFMEQWLRTCFAHVGKTAVPKKGDIMQDEITGMELVYIPAGCFLMGSDEKYHQDDDQDDESPRHKICLDAFWMGKCQVTQVQWQTIMGKNPSKFQNGGTYPVEQVSWNDVQKFIVKLNKQSGKAYRLPTEAEWEYACRADKDRKYDLDAVAWYYKNSGGSTHPVGEKPANPFGLHDMLGNVWEWCADRYLKNYYASSPEKNPAGPSSGKKRVLRGGCWIDDPSDCRVTFRYRSKPDDKSLRFGFRVVLPVR